MASVSWNEYQNIVIKCMRVVDANAKGNHDVSEKASKP